MEGRYGFGSVKVFERPELVARLLMQEYPICDAVSFDSEGRATEATECLLVGFGRVGQECLRKIVANGQFEGSTFHLAVFDPELENIDGFFKLRYGRMDKLAVQINHYYCGENESAAKQWERCDYFSRMSCRASADYINSLLSRLSIGKRAIEGKLLENLARSEHLRWCAFHYSMGYDRMSDETIKERGRMYLEDKAIRVLKDTKNKLHGCLVPWEELDALSDKESSYTGKKPDYKEMDRENVRIVHDILFAMPTETK